MPYDPQMSLVLALAVDQAYQKYTNPNHQIQLGNYVVKAEIFVYEGIPPVEKKTFFGFAASGSFGAGYPVNNIVAGAPRFTGEAIRTVLATGKGRMPAMPHLATADVDALVALLDPRWIEVEADWNPRGNVHTVITARHQQPGWRRDSAITSQSFCELRCFRAA